MRNSLHNTKHTKHPNDYSLYGLRQHCEDHYSPHNQLCVDVSGRIRAGTHSDCPKVLMITSKNERHTGNYFLIVPCSLPDFKLELSTVVFSRDKSVKHCHFNGNVPIQMLDTFMSSGTNYAHNFMTYLTNTKP
jgi:hypothetical protein